MYAAVRSDICEICYFIFHSYLFVRAPFAQTLKRSTGEGRPGTGQTVVELWARSMQCVVRGMRSNFFFGGREWIKRIPEFSF